MENETLPLPDLLRILPVDAQRKVLGDSFSSVAASRLACKELQELCGNAVSHIDLSVSLEALASLRKDWQTKSPSTLFPSVTRLSLRLPGTSPAGSQAASMLLRAMPPRTRQRITHVTLLPASGDCTLDYMQLVVALGEHLPALQVLEFVDSRDLTPSRNTRAAGYGDHWVYRLLGIFGAIATFMPDLRRLTLPRLSCPVALPWLGTLGAGCPQLRELTLTTSGYNAPAELTSAGVEALCGLAELEQLTLSNLEVGGHLEGAGGAGEQQAGGGLSLWPLQLLLGARRPPRLRRLVLEGGYFSWAPSAEALEVSFEPGLGCVAAGAGPGPETGAGGLRAAPAGPGACAWGISRVKVQPSTSDALVDLDALAAVVLEAAEALGQRVLPQLAVPQLSLVQREEAEDAVVLGPEGALARLAAHCARVEVGRLVIHQGAPQHVEGQQLGQEAEDAGGSPHAAVLAVVRALGLPRVLQLRHGDWACGQQALLPLAGAAPPVSALSLQPEQGRPQKRQRAAPQDPEQQQQQQQPQQQPQPPQQQQQLQTQTQTQEQQQGRVRRLHLDTANPEEVLKEALDRLWAKAVVSSSDHHAHGDVSSDESSGRSLAMVLLRSCPRPSPAAAAEAAAAGATEAACCCCRGLASRSAGCPHVAVPALGQLLLECHSGEEEAALVAALLSSTATTGQQQQQQQQGTAGDGTAVEAGACGCSDGSGMHRAAVVRLPWRENVVNAGCVLKEVVLQVLDEIWTGGAGGLLGWGGSCGGADSGADGVSAMSATSGGGGAAAAAAAAGGVSGGGRKDDQGVLLARLQRLLELDVGVRRLWSHQGCQRNK